MTSPVKRSRPSSAATWNANPPRDALSLSAGFGATLSHFLQVLAQRSLTFCGGGAFCVNGIGNFGCQTRPANDLRTHVSVYVSRDWNAPPGSAKPEYVHQLILLASRISSTD